MNQVPPSHTKRGYSEVPGGDLHGQIGASPLGFQIYGGPVVTEYTPAPPPVQQNTSDTVS